MLDDVRDRTRLCGLGIIAKMPWTRTHVFISRQRLHVFVSIKRELPRRSAFEAVIGDMKLGVRHRNA